MTHHHLDTSQSQHHPPNHQHHGANSQQHGLNSQHHGQDPTDNNTQSYPKGSGHLSDHAHSRLPAGRSLGLENVKERDVPHHFDQETGFAIVKMDEYDHGGTGGTKRACFVILGVVVVVAVVAVVCTFTLR